jgi:flagellar FliL protein
VAEEKTTPEAESEDAGNKSKKKLLIVIIVVGVLAVLLSVGVTLYLLGGDEEPVAEEVVKTPSGKDPASYFAIKQPFLVTFNVEGRQRYMQVSITAVSRDAMVFSAFEHHLPLIMSRLNSSYSAADFNELKTEAGKLALQEKSLSVINEILEGEGAGKIENVYFTNFVLQ